jgi:nitrogen-specific signal transduction histidine kinase
MEERQHAEEERRKLEARMQHAQRLESMGVLAGGIAHDFNNLLACVMGYASLALPELPAGSRAHAYIDQVLAAASSGADLTRQMLAYSGRGKFVLERLNLSELIEGVVRLLDTTISKKASLQFQLNHDLPPIEADAAQLRQVVMNLITNASDSLGDSVGVIRVSTSLTWAEPGELPPVEPGHTMPAGLYTCLEVDDTGCGMDAETQAKIFDPFFSTKFTGRGLGLAAVLGIVRGHHGTIKVTSEPGKGTSFRVMFPVLEDWPDQVATAQPGLQEWRGEGVVLVVDDEEPLRNLASTILQRAGLTVLTAVDGPDAVQVFRQHSAEIRAVLLDLTMPGMDGREVLQHITGLRPDIKVVLCSGYNEQDVASRMGGQSPAAFLRKPYYPAELIDRLRSIW